MAKSRKPVSPVDREVPALTAPRRQVRAELEERVSRGRDLLERPINSENALQQVRSAYYTWTEYNKDLLRKRFTTSIIADDYSRVGGVFVAVTGYETLADKVSDLQHDILKHVRRIESVIERLDLFDDPTTESVFPRQLQARTPRIASTIFVVHGHDEARKQEVARFLGRLTPLKVVILHEEPNRGRTIIEKFEDHASEAAFAVVLMTGDDIGAQRATENEAPQPQLRPRQNVVLELGFFMGALGRDRVAVLYGEGVEYPSDVSGVLYTRLDSGGAWRSELARELRSAHIAIDPDVLI